MLKELFTVTVLIFFLSSLINVIISTMKTVLTVKASKQVATFINCLNYTINTVIIKQITECETWIAAIVTFFTNLIGVYFALWLIDRFRKDKVWKITVTIKALEVLYQVVDTLEDIGIEYRYTTVYYGKMKKGGSLEIFVRTKDDSRLVKEILDSINCKYDVVEVLRNEL